MKANILLVDDEAELIDAIEDELIAAGINKVANFSRAQNGLEAVEKMEKENFCLVITDVRMPKMDGIEFVSTIRKKKIEVPVVFISGHVDVKDIMKLKGLNIFKFFQKPIRPDDMVKTVLQAIKLKNNGKS